MAAHFVLSLYCLIPFHSFCIVVVFCIAVFCIVLLFLAPSASSVRCRVRPTDRPATRVRQRQEKSCRYPPSSKPIKQSRKSELTLFETSRVSTDGSISQPSRRLLLSLVMFTSEVIPQYRDTAGHRRRKLPLEKRAFHLTSLQNHPISFDVAGHR